VFCSADRLMAWVEGVNLPGTRVIAVAIIDAAELTDVWRQAARLTAVPGLAQFVSHSCRS
jgi:hypothetical protein